MTSTKTYPSVSLTQQSIPLRPLTNKEKLDIGVKRGLEAGLLMGAYQWILHLLHISDILFLQMLSYAYLALVLLRCIRKSKPRLGRKKFFPGALTLGSLISLFASLTVLLMSSSAEVWNSYTELEKIPIAEILTKATSETIVVFFTGCIASLFFWRIFRYPKITL